MIEDLLKKRTNVTFFRDDKIPDKSVIEKILEKAHVMTPHKNNFDNRVAVTGVGRASRVGRSFFFFYCPTLLSLYFFSPYHIQKEAATTTTSGRRE